MSYPDEYSDATHLGGRAPRWPEAECLHEHTTSAVDVATHGVDEPVRSVPSMCLDCGKVI